MTVITDTSFCLVKRARQDNDQSAVSRQQELMDELNKLKNDLATVSSLQGKGKIETATLKENAEEDEEDELDAYCATLATQTLGKQELEKLRNRIVEIEKQLAIIDA